MINRRGFTLVEVMVSLIVIVILSGIAVPIMTGLAYQSKLNKDIIDAKNMQDAINAWITVDKDAEDIKSYNLLSNNVADGNIGGKSMLGYYKAYAGTGQLPGTEFSNEASIRMAVLSSLKSIMGNEINIDYTNWTIEGPSADVNMSFRYYYRVGLVKVVRIDEHAEIEGDELYGYYITLNRRGNFYKVASSVRMKEEEENLVITSKSWTSGLRNISWDTANPDIEIAIIENLVNTSSITTSCYTASGGSTGVESIPISEGLYRIKIYKLNSLSSSGGNTVYKDYFCVLGNSASNSRVYSLPVKILNTDKFNTELVDDYYIELAKSYIDSDGNRIITSGEMSGFVSAVASSDVINLLTLLGAVETGVDVSSSRYNIK